MVNGAEIGGGEENEEFFMTVYRDSVAHLFVCLTLPTACSADMLHGVGQEEAESGVISVVEPGPVGDGGRLTTLTARVQRQSLSLRLCYRSSSQRLRNVLGTSRTSTVA